MDRPSPSTRPLPFETATVFRSPKGTAHLWTPLPHLVVSRVEGVITAELAEVLAAAGRKSAAITGRLLAFHDWWGATDYETNARIILVNAGNEMKKQTDGVHMLIQSKLIVFAVQSANLLLRNLTAYSDPTRFEQALRDAMRVRGSGRPDGTLLAPRWT